MTTAGRNDITLSKQHETVKFTRFNFFRLQTDIQADALAGDVIEVCGRMGKRVDKYAGLLNEYFGAGANYIMIQTFGAGKVNIVYSNQTTVDLDLGQFHSFRVEPNAFFVDGNIIWKGQPLADRRPTSMISVPTANDIIDIAYIKVIKDGEVVAHELLPYDDGKRVGLEDVVRHKLFTTTDRMKCQVMTSIL